MELSIQDLIESIGSAVSQAQLNIEKHSIYSFFDYFNEQKVSSADNTDTVSVNLTPKTAAVALPSSNDLNTTTLVNVPLVSLVQHRQVTLDKVTVKLKPCLYADDDKTIRADMNAPAFHETASSESSDNLSKIHVDPHQSEIELVFQLSDSAEGLSRVVQNITKIL